MNIKWASWNGATVLDADKNTMAIKCVKHLMRHKKRHLICQMSGDTAIIALRDDDDDMIDVYDLMIRNVAHKKV